MKHLLPAILTLLVISFVSSCRNNKSNNETDIDSLDQVWEIQEPANEDKDKESSPIVAKKDTVLPHSQVMKRDLKEGEYETEKETRIGKLVFSGYKPSHHAKIGSVEVYHNGSLTKLGEEDGITYWEGDGDVWVIYHSPAELGKNDFKIHGRLQEKMDFR